VITTLPDGNTTRSDFSGTIVTLTDQVNRKIKRETDGLGRLIKVTEQTSAGALTQETSYSYSLLNKLTLVNQGNQARAYKYDAMGRLLYEKIPEQTATINDGTGTYWTSAYAYTEYSALKKRTDARGVETHYKQDALHRITNIWYTGLGGDDSGSVRPGLPSGVAGTGDMLYGYTAWGALSSVTIPSQYSETYAFDEFSRPTSVTRWLGQVYTGYKTYTTSYEYNQGGQLTKMIYPSGQQVVVNHDDKGRVQSLSGVTGMSYNIAGQVTGLTLGNGVVESYGYDANRLQLTNQTATKGATSLMNVTYNYQASAGQMGAGSTAGNTGQLMSISGTINSTTESAAYTYDLLGRLVTSDQSSNGSSAQRLFEYDRWGNRTAVYNGLPGGKTPPTQIQSLQLQQSGGVPTNRITSVTNSGSTVNYVYDAAGNVTNDGAHAYTYDAENRVVSVDGGVTAQYKYDHQNRRVTKTVGSTWTHYIWEGSQVIGEHDATTPVPGYGQPSYQEQSARVDYVYAGARMIRTRQRATSTAPWVTQYDLSDRLSVRMTLDSSGNVLGRQAHLPFGEDFGESGTQEKHHFTSYELDTEIGSDYAANRQYSSSIGRFGRPDPFNGSSNSGVPQSLNRYSYVHSDPVNGLDPLGLDGCQYVSLFFPGTNGEPAQYLWVFLCLPHSGGATEPSPRVPPPNPYAYCMQLMKNATAGYKNQGSPTLGQFRDADLAAQASAVGVEVILATWWLETSFSENPVNNQGHFGPLQIGSTEAQNYLVGTGYTLNQVIGEKNSRLFTGNTLANLTVGGKYLANFVSGAGGDDALAVLQYFNPSLTADQSNWSNKAKDRYGKAQHALKAFKEAAQCIHNVDKKIFGDRP
jgi:RHS repeat-associated protein